MSKKPFKRKQNSLCIVVYDVQGDSLSNDLTNSLEQAVQAIVGEHSGSLAINITKE